MVRLEYCLGKVTYDREGIYPSRNANSKCCKSVLLVILPQQPLFHSRPARSKRDLKLTHYQTISLPLTYVASSSHHATLVPCLAKQLVPFPDETISNRQLTDFTMSYNLHVVLVINLDHQLLALHHLHMFPVIKAFSTLTPNCHLNRKVKDQVPLRVQYVLSSRCPGGEVMSVWFPPGQVLACMWWHLKPYSIGSYSYTIIPF